MEERYSNLAWPRLLKNKDMRCFEMKHILIIDDDVHIGNMLYEVLTSEGYKVSRAYSGTEALLLLSSMKPDLILLDLMLPGLSGEEILPQIKGIPVIVVSAKVDMDNKVDLLLGGASDYITKPFNTKELLARITVQLRKTETTDVIELKAGQLTLNEESRDVSFAGKQIKLTKTEYAILKLLVINKNRTISKSVILDKISIDTPDCTEDSLKQHISNLRVKLRNASGIDMIEAVWGIGYKLIGE